MILVLILIFKIHRIRGEQMGILRALNYLIKVGYQLSYHLLIILVCLLTEGTLVQNII